MSSVCGSLKDALVMAESVPTKELTFQSAWDVFERLGSFRAAAVVFVSRLPPYMWDSTALYLEGHTELEAEEAKIFRALSAIMEVNVVAKSLTE